MSRWSQHRATDCMGLVLSVYLPIQLQTCHGKTKWGHRYTRMTLNHVTIDLYLKFSVYFHTLQDKYVQDMGTRHCIMVCGPLYWPDAHVSEKSIAYQNNDRTFCLPDLHAVINELLHLLESLLFAPILWKTPYIDLNYSNMTYVDSKFAFVMSIWDVYSSQLCYRITLGGTRWEQKGTYSHRL